MVDFITTFFMLTNGHSLYPSVPVISGNHEPLQMRHSSQKVQGREVQRVLQFEVEADSDR